MIQLRAGTERRKKTFDRVFAAQSTLVKREFFWFATFANRFQFCRNFIEGFVPRDPFPLAFAAFSDSFERK